MALVLADRVRETTTTAGTGTITLLGAVPSCQSFAVVGNGNTTYYTIVAQSGTEWEVGIGTYTSAGTTLSRDTVLSSSNSGSLVNFSAGTKDVFVDYPASKAVYEDASGNVNGYPITGGTIDNTVIGGTTPAAGTFTTLTAQIAGATTAKVWSNTNTSPIADLELQRGTNATWGGDAFTDYRIRASGGNFILQSQNNTTAVLDLLTIDETNNAIKFSPVGVEQMRVTRTASAVNYVQVTGAATTASPVISAQGSDTNIPLTLNSKGNNGIVFQTRGAGTPRVALQLLDSGSASVNYLQIQSNISGAPAVVSALGSDTNIGMAFISKGTGAIDLAAGTSGVNISNGGTVTAITRTNAGSGYTTIPNVVITAPTTAGGVQATASIGSMVTTGAAVVSGGTGYTLNDTITLVGGTNTGVAATFTVTGVSGGVITSASPLNYGQYSVLPTNPVSVTGGTGSGATFNINYGVGSNPAFTITNAGSGYVEQPTVSFSGGGGSGAAAYATVGGVVALKGLGTNLDVFTANANRAFRFYDSNSTGVNYWSAANGTTPVLYATGSSNTSAAIITNGTGSITFQSSGGAATQAVIAHTASAVNYVQVTGGVTGGGIATSPTIGSQGSDANVSLNLNGKGSGGVRISAQRTNFITVSGSGSGAGLATFTAEGGDTNIDINLTTKGTGSHRFNSGNGEQFRVYDNGVASVVNFWSTRGAPTGSTPLLYAQGADANVNGVFTSAGTGYLAFRTNGNNQEQFRVSHTASAVNYLQATGSATGSGVTLSAQGSDTNIDINLVPKGTGNTVYTGGVTVNGTLTAQTEVLKGTGQNFLNYSQTFTNAIWLSINTSVTDNTTVAPNGTTTAATVTLNVSSANFFKQNVNVIAGTQYTFSFYVLRGTATDMKYSVYNNSANAEIVAATSYYSLTNSSTWSRITLTFTTPAGCANVGIYPSRDSASTGTFFLWGAQLELGSIANTYIPTTTTAVYGTPTLSFSGVAGLGLQSDGSFYVQPAGVGALQAAPTTSTTVGGNVRGGGAVDWQIYPRTTASQVASGFASNIAGGYQNTASGGVSGVLSGTQNTAAGAVTVIAGGIGNGTALSNYGNSYSFVGSGYTNGANGVFNFVGGGFTNSGTSASAVTTQSATMNGTTAVTLSGSNASIKVGQIIAGTSINNFPPTYVAAISGTSLTLSQAASGSSTSTLSFYTPHGVVVGGGNNQATGSYSFIGGGGDAGTAANRNVASGDWSFVGGGQINQATNARAIVVGGYSNQATGPATFIGGGEGNFSTAQRSVVVGGLSNTANADYSTIVGGIYGTARAIAGSTVFTSAYSPIALSAGVSQSRLMILARQTTDATATILSTDINTPGSINQVILPNNSAYYFKGSVIANVTGAANGAAWAFEGAIMRGANAASTVLIGTVTLNRIATTAGASLWTVALTADTTNGGLAVTVTGTASTTIRWVAKVETTEVTF